MKGRLKKAGLVLLAAAMSAAFLFSPLAGAVTADVADISNRLYEENTLRLIDAAQGQISVAMFSMYARCGEADNPALKLIDALNQARSRGVDVRVYLDRYAAEGSQRTSNSNDAAYKMLKDAGVDVYFIRPDIKLHVKLIVIDDETVIDGSTNWTQKALQANQESALVIRSKEFAAIKMAQMAELEKLVAVTESPKKELLEKVRIKNSFLEDARFGPAMVTNGDERTFDFYLLLLRWFKEDRKANRRIDYVFTAKQLGIKVETRDSEYRRLIRELARKLKEVYFLADYRINANGELEVTLLDVDTGKEYTTPQKGDFNLPLAYWTYGLDRQLSLKARFVYLLSLYEQEIARPKPWWSKSNEVMQKKYHVFASTLSAGMMELERKDLIDIRNSRIDIKDPQRYAKRKPNQYQLKELISPQERARSWQQLEQELGAPAFKQAKEFAAAIEEDHDLQAVRDFARITKRFGPDKVRQAVGEVSKMGRDNPLRSIAYIVGILERMEREEGK